MKKKLSLIFKIIIVIMSGIGLYLNFKIAPLGDTIVYFTILSNLLCFVFYFIIVTLALLKRLKKNNIYYILKGMVTMAITLTMFVYQIVLSTSGTMEIYEGHMVACNFVHLIVPLLIIFDYIVFGEKGNLKKEYPFIWSLLLIAYIIFVTLYSALGGTFMGGSKYPYYYMDIEKYGLYRVFINNLVIYVFFIGYGFIVQTLDNKLGKNIKNNQKVKI